MGRADWKFPGFSAEKSKSFQLFETYSAKKASFGIVVEESS
jgi:hypothetical protein